MMKFLLSHDDNNGNDDPSEQQQRQQHREKKAALLEGRRQQRRQRQQQQQSHKQTQSSSSSTSSSSRFVTSYSFRILVILLSSTILISIPILHMLLPEVVDVLQQNEHEQPPSPPGAAAKAVGAGASSNHHKTHDHNELPNDYMYPLLPLEPFQLHTIPEYGSNYEQLCDDTLTGKRISVAGVAICINRFIIALRRSNQQIASQIEKYASASSTSQLALDLWNNYYPLVNEYLLPLDKSLLTSSNPIPIRNDDSIFVSVAAFREHMLGDTLASAFTYAKYPSKLYVGVIVQSCFETPCHQGIIKIGPKFNDLKSIDVANFTDSNGIIDFCSNQTFTKYCDGGHIRPIYINETEALGPAVTRYYASKLWAGETYFVQVDAHLQFAQYWDELYIQELKLTKNYPKSILSTYPPGFINFHQYPPFTKGTRLCKCGFSKGEDNIVRIEMNGRCDENTTKRPTQMPFVGAGFYMTHSQFIKDVPYDPYLAWSFMGEEIALSTRAWTSGYNIYAPRYNYIGHHYRPLKLGLPHYWDTVTREFHNKPRLSGYLMTHTRKRIKNLLGYKGIEYTTEFMKQNHMSSLLTELHETYGLGNERTLDEYLQFAEIDMEKETCGKLLWCTNNELE